MSLGQMNGFADIVKTKQVKDSEGFIRSEDEVIASIRVYREGRHGSERWANLAAFSEATDLFRFRCIPGLTITTEHFLICDGERFNITSVENVKGRGMYIEVLAKRSESLPNASQKICITRGESRNRVFAAASDFLLHRARSPRTPLISSWDRRILFFGQSAPVLIGDRLFCAEKPVRRAAAFI